LRPARGLSDTDRDYVSALEAQKMHLRGNMMELARAILLGLLIDSVFRKCFTVTGGFTRDDARKDALRTHVQTIPADLLPDQLAKRCTESGLATG
jgi:hypothetical protein